jgi:cytochrome c peroxidase
MKWGVAVVVFAGGCAADVDVESVEQESGGSLNSQLEAVLDDHDFTGEIESQLEAKLGRPINQPLAELGRYLFFDRIQSLHSVAGDDEFGNPCAGCHDPAFGFGDSQRIAIGVDNNNISGPDRDGPRNQRRAPFSVNAVFYPKLMWTPRFIALSGDPFDNSGGFLFPDAAGGLVTTVQTLLMAQGTVAPTELVEMAGFTGTTAAIGGEFAQFDDGHGEEIPDPTHDPIQVQVNARIGAIAAYREMFGDVFNGGVPIGPDDVTTDMRRQAIGEFQATLLAANAPIDRFARGQRWAMTDSQKRGALLFFGKAKCVGCHAVSGGSNEMFSDFEHHRIGAPQVFPDFGVGLSNMIYDGPGRNEDFGFEQTEGNPDVRYTFRTAPLRNLKVALGFFHNGAIKTIRRAIKHHFNPQRSLNNYDPDRNDLPDDLHEGPFAAMVAMGLDPKLPTNVNLSRHEMRDLTNFVKNGLFDDKMRDFCDLIPAQVPSGMLTVDFQNCDDPDDDHDDEDEEDDDGDDDDY